MSILVSLLLIIIFILLNAFFVASEFALVSIRRTRMVELANRKNKNAKKVVSAVDDLDTYISATQLGITIASLALGWVGEPAMATFIDPALTFLPSSLSEITSHTVSIIIAFSLITFLHIVIGELTPKSLALQTTDKTALAIITPLKWFTVIFRPAIWFLNSAGIIVLKLLGMSGEIKHPLHSEEEIKMILDQSGEGGVIEQREVEMVHNVFLLGDLPIKQVMIPRTDVVAFPKTVTLEELITKIRKYNHSRYPIYDGSIDRIIGFIHVKDIYQLSIHEKKSRKLTDLNCIRETITVHESKKADDVLRDMRLHQVHMVVVDDEYGGTAGVVSLEDILEKLVGEMGDEFDRPAKQIVKDRNTYIIDGLVPVERIQRRFDFPLRGQGYTTIGGLLFGLLGREPREGDYITIGDYKLEVASMNGRRIGTIRLTPLKRRVKRL